MIVRVIEMPDGTIRVMKANPIYFATDDEARVAYDRDQAEIPDVAGLPFADIDESDLPGGREARDRWRLRDGRVVVADRA